MDETKITGRLPMVDIEMTRRELPEENAETITLHMRAMPSVEAFARAMLQPTNSPLSPFFAAWTTPTVNPFLPWLQMTQAMWAPWLQAMMPTALPQQAVPTTDEGSSEKSPKGRRRG